MSHAGSFHSEKNPTRRVHVRDADTCSRTAIARGATSRHRRLGGPPSTSERWSADDAEHDVAASRWQAARWPGRSTSPTPGRRARSSWCRRWGRRSSGGTGAGSWSEPRTPRRSPRHRGARPAIRRRIASSAARSASLTGVRSGLVSTCRSSRPESGDGERRRRRRPGSSANARSSVTSSRRIERDGTTRRSSGYAAECVTLLGPTSALAQCAHA